MTEKNFNQLFARNLRSFLELNQMTQLELSRLLGVGTTSVYNWCNGVKTPRMDKVDKMCAIFSCKRSDLITDQNTNSVEQRFDIVLTSLETELIEAFRNASPDLRSAACAVLGIKGDAALATGKSSG